LQATPRQGVSARQKPPDLQAEGQKFNESRIQGAAAIGLLEPHFVAKEVDKLIFRRTLGS
jgi:hypothetical protein